ncbi:MAG: helix-turn-helix domain-containing protein [Chloroflexi bacterium]|nr:helix-turn-helix domain-containing protein [Chloroflexota bacterium]MBA3851762.1 helix-turn-helix domain-containing protein [Chloroflexota bacterium]
MTARHQLRVGGRRVGRDRDAIIGATPAPSLGEMLRIARERRGVDIYRAERDTKIRARHLDALEAGDYAALPGAVYTKGFLRNYALYLGLDANEMLERWRVETATLRRTEPVSVAPPRPLAAPRRGLIFTPGILVSALLSVLVIAFLGYVAMQVMRFSQGIEVTVEGAVVRQLDADAETTVLAGTTAPGATLTITGPSDFHATTDADDDGTWSITVPVTKGQNEFTITGIDPGTDRSSPPLNVIAIVPVPATAAPSGAGSSQGLPAISLTLSSPAGGAVLSEVEVTVAGTTSGSRVAISAQRRPVVTIPGVPMRPAGPETPDDPRISPSAAPAGTEPLDISVTDGRFSGDLTVAPGSWTITVRSSATGHADAVETRDVEVRSAAVVVIVTAVGSGAYIQAWEDGEPSTARILRPDRSLTFTAEETILVRTGNAGATHFTVNGEELGALGGLGKVENWLFERGEPPRRSK